MTVDPIEISSEFDETDMIRQGDVVGWRTRSDPWKTCGVIVTSDCDLMRKNRGFINYVPIIGIAEYVNDFIACDEATRQVDGWLRELCGKVRALHASDAAPLSDHAIETKVLRCSGAGEILNALGIRDADVRYRFTCEFERKIALIQQHRRVSGDAGYVDLWRSVMDVVAGEKGAERVAKKIKEKVSSPPDDVFFLSGVPGYHDMGCFMMMRYIREIAPELVFKTPGECLLQQGNVYRVARLQPRFLYHVTRKLAAIFTDVGLPGTYNEIRASSGAAHAAAIFAGSRP